MRSPRFYFFTYGQTPALTALRADYSTFETKLTQLYPKVAKKIINRLNQYARELSEYDAARAEAMADAGKRDLIIGAVLESIDANDNGMVELDEWYML